MTDTITETTIPADAFTALDAVILDGPAATEETTSEADRWVPDPDAPVSSAMHVLDLLKSADTGTLLRMHAHQLRIKSLTDRIAAVNQTILNERTEHQSWLAMVQERAHEHATDVEWCPVADQCLEDLGFEGRGPRTEDVTVEVEAVVQMEWEYSDTSSAVDNAIINKVEADFGSGVDVDLNSLQIRFLATRKYSVTRTVDTGDCACGSIDKGDIADYFDVSTYDIESFEVDCSNC